MKATFDDFLDSLSNLQQISPREDPGMAERIDFLMNELGKAKHIDIASIAEFVSRYPDSVPILCTSAGLGQEQLKNQLRHKLKTSAWVTLARTSPESLIRFLDEEFGLVEQLTKEMQRQWTYSDIILERHLWSRGSGASSVDRGKKVEDAVEELVKSLALPYEMRTRFTGRGGETAPCDLAIPRSGDSALIVIGMKGFNSTGSKLTDAVGEIERMASVRLPRQYVYAVVDGIGWLSRQSDLRRIYSLWETQQIDGLFTLRSLDRLHIQLLEAVTRLQITKNVL